MQTVFELMIYIILVIATMFVAVLIHELGHLVCGLISGYKFSLFRFLTFTLTNEDDKLKLKSSKNSLILGQCLMIPPKNEEDFKFVLYNMGGGLFNLISGIIAFLCWLFLPTTLRIFSVFLLVLAVESIYLAAVNLIPLYANGVPNDGMNIKQGLKSKEAKHGFYVMLSTNADLISGKRLRDIDTKLLKVNDSSKIENYLEAYPLILASEQLMDMGEYDEAIDLLSTIKSDNFPRYYRTLIKLDLLYYYSAIKTDKEKALKIYDDKYLQKMLNSGVPTFARILAAYEYFINSDQNKATQLLDKAKAGANSLPSKGQVIMENEGIAELERLMNESV